MKAAGYRPHASKVLFTLFVSVVIMSLVGCDAFVRKFTRKPKTENQPEEEMVLVPETYAQAQIPKEELYRQYFLFWKSWHAELIQALSESTNRKKKIDCAQETIDQLLNVRAMLVESQKKKLDIYIAQCNELKSEIARDTYGNNSRAQSYTAEIVKRKILRDFAFQKIKNDLL